MSHRPLYYFYRTPSGSLYSIYRVIGSEVSLVIPGHESVWRKSTVKVEDVPDAHTVRRARLDICLVFPEVPL